MSGSDRRPDNNGGNGNMAGREEKERGRRRGTGKRMSKGRSGVGGPLRNLKRISEIFDDRDEASLRSVDHQFYIVIKVTAYKQYIKRN